MAKEQEFTAKEIADAKSRLDEERSTSVIVSRADRLARAAGMSVTGGADVTTTGTSGGTGATTGTSRGGK